MRWYAPERADLEVRRPGRRRPGRPLQDWLPLVPQQSIGPLAMQEQACLSQSRQGNPKRRDGTSAMPTIVAKSAPGEAHATSSSFYQAASPRRLPQEPTVRSAGAAAVCS